MPKKSSPERARLTPELLALAAAELADACGDPEAVTLAQLAERFAVRVPSLYNHVDGLAGLRRAVALLSLRALHAKLADAAIGQTGAAALTAIAHAYRDFATHHPGRYRATLRAPEAADHEMTAVANDISALMLRVLAPAGLSDEDALHAIRALRSLTHGFVSLEALGGFGLKLDRDESYRRLVDTFVTGLRLAS